MCGLGMLEGRMCGFPGSSPDPVGEGGASHLQCEAMRKHWKPVARSVGIIEILHCWDCDICPGNAFAISKMSSDSSDAWFRPWNPVVSRRLGLRHAADRCAAAGWSRCVSGRSGPSHGKHMPRYIRPSRPAPGWPLLGCAGRKE